MDARIVRMRDLFTETRAIASRITHLLDEVHSMIGSMKGRRRDELELADDIAGDPSEALRNQFLDMVGVLTRARDLADRCLQRFRYFLSTSIRAREHEARKPRGITHAFDEEMMALGVALPRVLDMTAAAVEMTILHSIIAQGVAGLTAIDGLDVDFDVGLTRARETHDRALPRAQIAVQRIHAVFPADG